MKKGKQIMACSIAIGLVVSSLGSMTGIARSAIATVKESLVPDNSVHIDAAEAPPAEKQLNTQTFEGELPVETTVTSEEGQPVADRYNFSKSDVEQLIKEGYSVEDMMKADELGNSVDKDPKAILKEKKERSKSWTQMERELRDARFAQALELMKKRHPKEFAEINRESFTNEEKLILLAVVDQYLVSSASEAVAEYKKNKDQAISKIYKENKFYGKVSKEKMKKYNLTDADVQDLRLTDEKLSKMEGENPGGETSSVLSKMKTKRKEGNKAK